MAFLRRSRPWRGAGWALLLGVAFALASCVAGGLPEAPATPRAAGPAVALAQTLRAAELPLRDDAALARDLALGGTPVPRVLRVDDPAPALGATERFWLSGLDGGAAREITATLRLRTPNVEMWLEEGVAVEEADLRRAAEALEERIIPSNRRHFGDECRPGIDGNPRLVVLNARFSGAAGYFSAANQYARAAHPYSNEREMFVMNVAALSPGTAAYESVLAHEYQHMIHWHQDGNEDAWLNEGLSQLAEDLAGYGSPDARLRALGQAPDLQLTDWPAGRDTALHYGASYLFVRYLYDRYGPEAIRALTAEPRNGLAGVTEALRSLGIAEADGDALFADWLLANALDAEDWPDPRYAYPTLEISVAAEAVAAYPATIEETVRQYGADYYALEPQAGGALEIAFRGEPTVPLLPNTPPSGSHQWWSGRGDNSHTFLERAVDLTALAPGEPVTLTFRLWYDLEEGWDFGYLRASADGGETWRVLQGAYVTDHNPHGHALGWGYTGLSGAAGGTPPAAEWVEEIVDLGPYAGEEILLRWDVVTDDSVNRPGLSLDDLAIPALGWHDDAEAGEAGWRAEGFLRHANVLAQEHLLQLVAWGPEGDIRRLEVGPDGQGAWRIAGWGAGVERALLVVSALAPETTEPAPYTLTLQEVA